MDKEESGVEKLKRKLYRRGEKPGLHERRELYESEHEEVKENWEEPVQENEAVDAVEEEKDPEQTLKDLYEGKVPGSKKEEPKEPQKKKSITGLLLKIFFVASFLFFLAAVGIAAYFVIGGKNQVSCRNVDIEIIAPQALASGKRVSLDVSTRNRNPVPMRNANIELRFPEGTRDVNESATNLTSSDKEIGTLEVQEKARSSFQAVLYGQEKSVKTIEAVISYGIDDSNATFTCSKEHVISITTAPLSLTVDGLEEISSGQEVELTIAVSSNAEEIIPDQRLVLDYPFGFEFVAAEPEPTYEDNVWELGDIAPNKERVVVVRGTVEGQGTEARAIDVVVGERNSVEEGEVTIVLQKVQHPLLITRPFLALTMSIDKKASGSGEQNTAIVASRLGERLSGTLYWKNTLPVALHNLEIDLNLDGSMLNPASVKAGNGFYRSIDNTIVWTPQTTKEGFRTIAPGEDGMVNFSFLTVPYQKETSTENPVMYMDTTVRAHRINNDRPVPQKLIGQTKKQIVFDSRLTLDAYALYGVGAFTNSGPHPPRVNNRTTYTIVWDLYNTVNDVTDIVARGELPVYMEWLGAADPQDERVTFDSITREVIWNVDRIEDGTGHKTQPRQVSFQVAVIPSVTQASSAIDLMEKIRVQGVDEFTKNVLESKTDSIDSELTRDPYFNNNWSKEVEE